MCVCVRAYVRLCSFKTANSYRLQTCIKYFFFSKLMIFNDHIRTAFDTTFYRKVLSRSHDLPKVVRLIDIMNMISKLEGEVWNARVYLY